MLATAVVASKAYMEFQKRYGAKYSKHSAHHNHQEISLPRRDYHVGLYEVILAKKTAAFFRKSRPGLVWRSSCFTRTNFSCLFVVSAPDWLFPASISACRIHCRSSEDNTPIFLWRMTYRLNTLFVEANCLPFKLCRERLFSCYHFLYLREPYRSMRGVRSTVASPVL